MRNLLRLTVTVEDVVRYPVVIGLWIALVFLSPVYITKLEHLTCAEQSVSPRPYDRGSYSFKFIDDYDKISTSPGASLLKPKPTNSSADITERSPYDEVGYYFADKYFDIPPPDFPNKQPKVYHIIQHSHTDAGWIKTMLYYYQQAVERILKSSVEYIHEHQDSASQFSFTNFDFLRMFLRLNPSTETKEIMDELIKNKRYEILNSAIAMPDQSVTYFEDLINNMEYGREYGLKTFGQISRHGWTIDNFGQSAFNSRLFAELGYDTVSTVRLPFQFKDRLKFSKNMNFIWESKYHEYDMFTHVFSHHYTPPFPALFFNEFIDEKIISTDFNLLKKVHDFFIHSRQEYDNYKEVNVMLPMGNDVVYTNFGETVRNHIKLYIGLRSNQKSVFEGNKFIVSSVEQYYKAIKEENLEYNKVPPSDYTLINILMYDEVDWWSGFFSVRPNLKYQIRAYGQFVRGVSSLIAYQTLQAGKLSQIYNWTYNILEDMRFSQGILQHHDAITGTCTNYVTTDYLYMASDGVSKGTYILKENLKETVMKHILPEFQLTSIPNGELIHWKNEELCLGFLPRDQPYSASVIVPKEVAARVMVKHSAICGEDICLVNADILPGQLTSIASAATGVHGVNIAEPKTIPLSEGQTYRWTCTSPQCSEASKKTTYTFGYSSNRLTVDLGNNLAVTASVNLDKDQIHDFVERNVLVDGVYTMHLFKRDPDPLHLSHPKVVLHTDGSVTLQAENKHHRIVFALHVDPRNDLWNITSRIIQGPAGTATVEKYMVRYFVEAVQSAFPKFRTDSNGFDLFDREYNEKERPEASYLPVAKFIQIQGEEYQFTVSVDRGAGASSSKPGYIDIMFNRATGVQDPYGMPERVMEERTIAFEQRLILEKKGGQTHRKMQAKEESFGLLVAATGTPNSTCHGTPLTFPASVEQQSAPLPKVTRPEHQYIKTFLDLAPDALKVRLYNLNDDLTITIDNVRDFIRERYNLSRQITIEERSLDYNQPISEILEQPYMWRNVTALKKAYAEETIGEKVVLKPLKMKTYKIIVDKPAK
jgi:hypothetical protein